MNLKSTFKTFFLNKVSGIKRIRPDGIRLIIFLFIAGIVAIYSACRKKNETTTSIPVADDSKQAAYFRNTNEIWKFHLQYPLGAANPNNVYFTFYKLKDSLVEQAGDTFMGTLMSEAAIRVYKGDSTFYGGNRLYFYHEKLRLLVCRDTVSSVILDFKYLDYLLNNRIVCTNNGMSFTYLKSHEIEKRGSKHYNIYFNSDGQKIIEGVTLQLSDCSIWPSVPNFNSSSYQLISAEYSSDEYYYKWTRE